jgi:hypothetical protein
VNANSSRQFRKALLDRESSAEAIADLHDEVYVLGDSVRFSADGKDVHWWIDLGPNLAEWEAEGIPTLLRAISGWA